MKLTTEMIVYRSWNKKDLKRIENTVMRKIETFVKICDFPIWDDYKGDCVYMRYILENPDYGDRVSSKKIPTLVRGWIKSWIDFGCTFPDEDTEDQDPSIKIGSEEDYANKHYDVEISDFEGRSGLQIFLYGKDGRKAAGFAVAPAGRPK